jgi:hypothetical protein
LIVRSPGSFVPIFATATFWPAATLGAPQTIERVSDGPPPAAGPTSTLQSESFSASGWRSRVRTRPTTTSLVAGAKRSSPSTSAVESVRSLPSCSGVMPERST